MTLSPRVADLDPYGLLDTIAVTGSIGACARQHGLSQPAVSLRIRGLEERLGLRLVERGPGGTTLTDSGRLVLEWARPALDAARTLDELLDALTGAAPAHLTLAASTTIAEFFLPTWLTTLRRALPNTGLTLLCHNSADTVALVRRGSAEIGFAASGHMTDDLEHLSVVRDRLVIVVAPDHDWAGGNPITPKDLVAAPLILRESGSATRTVLQERLSLLRHPLPVVPAMELTSATAIKNAAASGLGPAVLSELTVLDELADGTLVEVPMPSLSLTRDLHACWRQGHRLSAPARRLLELATGSPRVTPAPRSPV